MAIFNSYLSMFVRYGWAFGTRVLKTRVPERAFLSESFFSNDIKLTYFLCLDTETYFPQIKRGTLMGQPKGKAKVKAAAKQKAKASALLARRLSPQGPNNPNAPRQRQASPGLAPSRPCAVGRQPCCSAVAASRRIWWCFWWSSGFETARLRRRSRKLIFPTPDPFLGEAKKVLASPGLWGTLAFLPGSFFWKRFWPLTNFIVVLIKGSLGGETSALRTFRMSGKELVKERVSKERVRQGKS